MKTMKLRHVAQLINSNVDKVVDSDEMPVRLCNYVHVYRNDRISAGMELDPGSASPQEIARFGLRRNDVIITKDSEDRSDIAVPAYVPEDIPGVVCGYHLAILRPDSRRMRGDFLAWALRSRNLQDAAMLGALGVTRFGLSQGAIKSIDIPCPALDEQRALAAFLDSETARVDALIERKESLMALLYERERAMIDPLVLRGGRPASECAPVGPAWRRDVPPGWKRRRIRHMFRPEKRQNHVDLTVLSVFREFGVVEKDSQAGNNNKTPDDLSLYQLVEPRDLVINKMKGWQGSLGISGYRGITSPDYVVMTPTHDAEDAFIHHLLRSPSMIHAYRIISTGVRPAQWRVDVARVLDLDVWLPPREEQIWIVSQISGGFAAGREVMEKTRTSVHRLREFRSALITAAVNGQIDPEAWRRRGSTDRRLDRIEAEMTVEAAE